MTEVTREEFELLRNSHEQLTEQHNQTREKVAAGQAVQDRHDGDITKLSDKIDGLTAEVRACITNLTSELRAAKSSRARTVTAAITGGGAVGGSVAVGLYQLIHFLYPHLFGG